MARELLRRCTACHAYTLQDTCPHCSGPARSPAPAKYSPEDPYGEYRRRLKKLDAREKAEAAS